MRRLGMMKRNGAALMRRWKEQQRMNGARTKRRSRIFMRLEKEASGGLAEEWS